MINLIRKILRDHRLGVSLVSTGLISYAWFLVALYPSLEKIDIKKLISQYPKSLKAFFGGSFDMSTFEAFINIEYFSLMWVIIVVGYLISLATSEISKEIETGSIETLLALPISRTKVIIVKWLSVLIINVLLVAVTILSLIGLASAYNVSYNLTSLGMISIIGFLFTFSITSITMALAVFFNERSKATFIPLFILIFSYIWNSMGQLVESIKDYRYFSLFYFYDPGKALLEREITTASVVVFLTIIVTSTIFTFYWFKKRDFAV